jgi:hypothetical protein
MTIRIVQLGSPRLPDEGLRIGTVRRPPRGIRKERLAADDCMTSGCPNSPRAPNSCKPRKQRRRQAPGRSSPANTKQKWPDRTTRGFSHSW